MSGLSDSLRKQLEFVKAHRGEGQQSLPGLEAPDIIPLPDSHDAPLPLVAFDGSYSLLLSLSGIWVGVIRAVALHYELAEGGYKLSKPPVVREAAVSVTTEEAVVMDQDEQHRRAFKLASRYSAEPQREMMNQLMKAREEELALDVASEAPPSIMVLDGSLTPYKDAEQLAKLMRLAEEKGHVLVGVSKDSETRAFGRDLCDTEWLAKTTDEPGFVRVPKAFETLKGSAIYGGVLGDVYFAKLHPDSPRWFRVDVGHPKQEPGRAFSALARYCRSALCPGYPFPMMEAHRLAVVVRHFHEQYEDAVLELAVEAGIPLQEAMDGLTHVDGRRKAAFHEYLDKVSREMR